MWKEGERNSKFWKGTELNLWRRGWSLSLNRITSSWCPCFSITLNRTWNESLLVLPSLPTPNQRTHRRPPYSSYSTHHARHCHALCPDHVSHVIAHHALPSAWETLRPASLPGTLHCSPRPNSNVAASWNPLWRSTTLHRIISSFCGFPLSSVSKLAFTTSGSHC